LKYLFDKFFFPKSIAVFGATDKAEKVGFFVFRNLASFEGKVFAINPKYNTVQGRACYARLEDVAEAPDLAVIATPAETVNDIVVACGRMGVKAAVVLSAGFRGQTPDDLLRYQSLKDTASQQQVRIIGPNCLGLMTPSIQLNAAFAPVMPTAGRLAFISQSGALGTSVLDWAAHRKVGFSHFVSLGNMVDVGFHHLIDYFGADSRTACILIYMEHLKEARKFMSAARAFARSKPIIILKAGGTPTGAHTAMLHTGHPPGDDAVFDAAFRRAGVIRVHTIQELFDCAQAIAFKPLPQGNRLAIVTNGGGAAVLAADLLYRKGGRLAVLSHASLEALEQQLSRHWSRSNPLDVMGDASAQQYSSAVQACLFDAQADAVLAILSVQSVTDAQGTAQLVAAAAKKAYQKPLYASWMGISSAREGRAVLEENRIPWYPFPERAVAAFMHLAQYREDLELLYETPPDLPIQFQDIDRPFAKKLLEEVHFAEQRRVLGKQESKLLLQAYGIKDQGDIANAEFLNRGISVFISAWKDPVFGPVIAVGQGKSMTVKRERALGLPPLNLALARQMVQLARIFHADNETEVDKAEVQELLHTLLCRFAYLVMDFPEIYSISCHLILTESIQKVARPQALLESSRKPVRQDYSHLSIQPYPTQWIRQATLRDGTPVTLRPIRPEDEPLEAELVKNTSRESLYFRFFGFVPGVDHKMLARFTQIDYDREMAIVAQIDNEGKPQLIGVVRIVGDGWRDTAEYAILIPDQWQGKGIGSLLTDYIIQIAREQGYRLLTASFLKLNGKMRRLFERYGFDIRSGSDESDYAELLLTGRPSITP
jgi:acetyltransferase